MIGRVRDAQGKPVPGIRVFVRGPGDFDHTATDRDGVFEVPGLPRNPIQILLSRRQGKFQSETLAADRDRVEFTLRPESPRRLMTSPSRRRTSRSRPGSAIG